MVAFIRKYAVILIFCFTAPLLTAQNQQFYNFSEIKEMAVFPGCEAIKASNLNKQATCFTERLTQLLSKRLLGLNTLLNQIGISDVSANIQFIVSKEGVIIDIREREGSNPVLADVSINALKSISEEIPPIRPAKIKHDQSVNLLFQVPIRYHIEEQPQTMVATVYPVDEIVLFTLKENELKYEIRMFKNKDFKIYEIKENKVIYLGRFLSLWEIESSEPYKTLITQERKNEKTLIAEGSLEDGDYEIYIHNLFAKNKKKPIFVEVMKVNGNKRKTIANFEKEIEFNESRYAPLIYRN